MARNTVKSLHDLNEVPEITDPSAMDLVIEDDIEAGILAELNASPEDINWRFRVSRVLGAARNGMTEPQLFEGDASVMKGLADKLRDEYGTGKYRVRVLKNNKLYRRFDVEVEALSRQTQPTNNSPSEMATVLAAIERQNDRIMQLLERQTIQQPASIPVPSNPFEGIQQIASVMVSLKDLMGPKTDPTMSTVDAIMKGVELAKAVTEGNGGGGETSWMDLINSWIKSPMAAEMAKQTQQQQQPVRAIPQRPMPSEPGAPKEQVRQQPNPNDAEQMQAQIRSSLLYLCQIAAKNGNPELYAEWVLDNWPRHMVIAVLQQPNALQLAAQLAPETQPYMFWFKKLIEEIGLAIKDEAEEAATHVADASPDISPVQPIGNPGWGGGGEDNIEDDV